MCQQTNFLLFKVKFDVLKPKNRKSDFLYTEYLLFTFL